MKVSRTQLISALVGFVFGVVWLIAMRAILAFPDSVHYHANFAVFINGERETFDSFGYYEEVQACTADYLDSPRSRVHMHQPDNDVVHVHDHAATWGNLFENLGLFLGDEAIQKDDDIFVDGQLGELSFVLNGETTSSVANQLIASEDRLLISFGDPDETPGQYEQVSQTAWQYNQEPDPGACKGSQQPTLLQRLRHGVFE